MNLRDFSKFTFAGWMIRLPGGGNPTAQISGFNQVEGAVISR
ncbi:MAG TPA: hypothetical protein VGI19_17560 [Candidatus Cybelea sp.]